MKRSSVLTSLFICLSLLAVPSARAAQADGTTVFENKRFYFVKPGDTLAGIAATLLGAADRWPEIQRNNPQIKNPALIFPGDSLLIGEAPPAVTLGVREAPPVVRVEVPPPPPAPARPVTIAPAELLDALREEAQPVPVMRPVSFSEPPGIPAAMYETCGFITAELPEAAVIGGLEGKKTFSTFDTVFINRGDREGLLLGQEWRALRPVREIRHPKTGTSLGWLVKVVGRVKTECLQEHTATASVTFSEDYIKEGDLLEPYTPESLPAGHYVPSKLRGPCLPGTKTTAGLILAARDDKRLVGEGDVVYIDQGLANGVVPGATYAVIRQGLPDKGGTFLVGEVQVLLCRNTTSTALVTNSLFPIKTTDGLVTW